VEYPAIGRIDQHRIALGYAVRDRQIAKTERPEIETACIGDDVERDFPLETDLFQLAADQPGGKWRREQGNIQVGGEIGNRADMILVTMGQHDTEQVLPVFLDKFEIGQHQIDTRVAGIGKGHAEIDHHPFAVATVKVDVHADFARPA